MANASNNGLLPINNGQANGQGSYSQVSPMFGNYYNIAQAPTGNSVLGYNYGASGLMPGGVSGNSGGATPTPPSGGNLSIGSGNGGVGHASSGSNYGSNPLGGSSSYASGSPGTGGGAYTNNVAKAAAQPNYGAPVSAPASQPAAPHYSPSGPLAAPNSHAIPAQAQANSSGQMQGSSQPTNNANAWEQLSQWHAMANGNPAPAPNPRPPGLPGNPPPPIGSPGNPHTPPPTNPTPPSKPPTPPPPPPKKPGPPPPKPPVPKKPVPGKKPVPPSAIDKWLAGDTTYQQQLAEFNQEQQAYNTNYTNTKDQIGQNFDATQRSMNNQANLDRMNQQYDFAGRGVLSSGAYATALDQYNTQFQNNIANLVAGENQQNTTNNTNLNNFLRQITLQKDAAKQDAIARRAALLGITG